MKKRAAIILALLITISCFLLEAGHACYFGPPPQLVGQVTISDPSCNQPAMCRREYIYSVWNSEGISFQYVPQNCVACPAGNTPAMCGQ